MEEEKEKEEDQKEQKEEQAEEGDPHAVNDYILRVRLILILRLIRNKFGSSY